MRANGRDITELFGFAPDDRSTRSLRFQGNARCPFTELPCTKTNHDKSEVYGTCSVTRGVRKGVDVIVCPNRLYADGYATIRAAARAAWPATHDEHVIIGGSIRDLRHKALAASSKSPVVAFGMNSGREIQVDANGQLSMDWILQRYDRIDGRLKPIDFVGIEVQSIDITGNYRENWQAYLMARAGRRVEAIPESGHGLNWANVHKRLIPQLIRKGNIYEASERCVGFFFILPDTVFEKFEEVLGPIKDTPGPTREVVTVQTYSLREHEEDGATRPLVLVRTKNFRLTDVKAAFTENKAEDAPRQLDEILLTALG